MAKVIKKTSKIEMPGQFRRRRSGRLPHRVIIDRRCLGISNRTLMWTAAPLAASATASTRRAQTLAAKEVANLAASRALLRGFRAQNT